jgi:hypothetical protein
MVIRKKWKYTFKRLYCVGAVDNHFEDSILGFEQRTEIHSVIMVVSYEWQVSLFIKGKYLMSICG